MKFKNKSPNSSILEYCGILPIIPESVFLACGSRIIGDVTLAENVSVWFNTVIRGDVHKIIIGQNTNIQDNSCIHCTYKKYSTTIGDNVSIAHGVIIHGCTIEDNCLIGMGAVIMDGAVIGKGSLVAAGSIVSSRTIIPQGSLVMGTPGKVVRQVTKEEYDSFYATTLRYLEYAKGYDFRKLI